MVCNQAVVGANPTGSIKIVNVEQLRDFVYDCLEEPLAQMGCAGPPECEIEGCTSKGEHDTGLAMFQGVIEVAIDDKTFLIRIEEQGRVAQE